jgi:hypothetical protein
MRIFLIGVFLIALSGCASVPMDCEEACAFQRMVCKGAVITAQASTLRSAFGVGSNVNQASESLSYQCELDKTRYDEVLKIREKFIQNSKKSGSQVGFAR